MAIFTKVAAISGEVNRRYETTKQMFVSIRAIQLNKLRVHVRVEREGGERKREREREREREKYEYIQAPQEIQYLRGVAGY